VGDKKILGCGVPQMPCFGKVEYMRIGADMSLGWAHTLLRKNMHREDVSTPNAIHNSVYRRCLNSRAFLCDPDVFLLRRTNIKFTPQQQKLLAKFIKLFGGVLFMSDNIAEYDSEQMEIFNDTMADDAKLLDVSENGDIISVTYEQNGKIASMKFSNSTGEIY
jgi:alpha-galactosidase